MYPHQRGSKSSEATGGATPPVVPSKKRVFVGEHGDQSEKYDRLADEREQKRTDGQLQRDVNLKEKQDRRKRNAAMKEAAAAVG
jgi:hypothetical protein